MEPVDKPSLLVAIRLRGRSLREDDGSPGYTDCGKRCLFRLLSLRDSGGVFLQPVEPHANLRAALPGIWPYPVLLAGQVLGRLLIQSPQ